MADPPRGANRNGAGGGYFEFERTAPGRDLAIRSRNLCRRPSASCPLRFRRRVSARRPRSPGLCRTNPSSNKPKRRHGGGPPKVVRTLRQSAAGIDQRIGPRLANPARRIGPGEIESQQFLRPFRRISVRDGLLALGIRRGNLGFFGGIRGAISRDRLRGGGEFDAQRCDRRRDWHEFIERRDGLPRFEIRPRRDGSCDRRRGRQICGSDPPIGRRSSGVEFNLGLDVFQAGFRRAPSGRTASSFRASSLTLANLAASAVPVESLRTASAIRTSRCSGSHGHAPTSSVTAIEWFAAFRLQVARGRRGHFPSP